ncbi:MAG: hypothetical protein Q9223_001456 [Gallowayella weberi]
MSDPTKIKFAEFQHKNPSDYNDPNDPGILAKALKGIHIGKPETYGGSLKDPAKHANTIFQSFNTHTLPDLTPYTHVISVLGITEEALNNNNSPSDWFLSDFFAFWNLLQGHTQRQTWLHCLDLEKEVQHHQRFLHGNPFKPRKVVLDARILQAATAKDSKHPVQFAHPRDLRIKFVTTLKQHCTAADKAGETVLVLMFGHGDMENKGIYLGSNDRAFRYSHLKYALSKLKVNITLLTTQCYGGGWTMTPSVNITAMAAADKGNISKSWTYSRSCRRACGSMFATAIINKLTQDPTTKRSLMDRGIPGDDDDEPPTTEQNETYSSFCKTVYESLLKDIDRRGNEHGISFSAQDDTWEMCWHARTGIPLAKYKERWDNLDDWEADQTLHPGDPENRDPHVTAEERAEYIRLRDATPQGQELARSHRPRFPIDGTGTILGKRNMSESLASLIATVKVLGRDYLDSYPGHTDTSEDGGMFALIVWICQDRPTNIEECQSAMSAIQYRMEQQSAADRYVEMMSLSLPLSQLCHEFDIRPVKDMEDRARYDELFDLVFARAGALFPRPTVAQGRPFYKGPFYLMAAIDCSDISLSEAATRLDEVVQIVDEEVEQHKEIFKRDPEVSNKRVKLFGSFGHSRGDISPRKRMSISMD